MFNPIIYYWNLQFFNNVIINKTKVLLPQAYVTLADFAYPVLRPSAPKTFNYLSFQSSDFEHTWWRLFQKHVMHTILISTFSLSLFDIYRNIILWLKLFITCYSVIDSNDLWTCYSAIDSYNDHLIIFKCNRNSAMLLTYPWHF